MSFFAVLLLAVALSMDAFAVALASGCALRVPQARHYFRLSAAFGFFQFAMPVVGWYLGITVRSYMEAWDHWIAFALLGFIGGKMVLEGLKASEECDSRTDPTAGWPLLTLAVGTSIDALAVGFSFAAMKLNVWSTVVIIGAVTFALCWIGMVGGKQIGRFFGRRMEVLGGLVLIGIGLKILFDHLWK